MKYYTVKEVAEILRVKPICVYSWIRRGILECVRINTTIRVTEDQLNSLNKKERV
jgi:excisionase family DNA binding protein